MFNQFLTGPIYLLEGFRLLRKPGLKRYVLIPLFINLCFFIGLFMLMWHYVGEFNVWFAHYLPDWLHWLSAVLWLLFFISFFIVFIYTFVVIANLIAAPFNSLLAEKVEYILTGNNAVQRTWWENVKDVPRIIGRQLSLFGYFIPRALLCVVLFFIPVVQAIAPFLWFIFTAWFMTLTYIDYPTDNHRVPLAKVHEQLRDRRWLSFGFGASVLLISMLPIINLLAMPAAVAGATKLWIEKLR